MRILIIGSDLLDVNTEYIKNIGYNSLILKEKEIASNLEKIYDFNPNVMICYNPFDILDLSKMRDLKWIQITSVGTNHIPIEIVRKNNIIITNNSGGYATPVGEWIVAQVLSIYKQSYSFFRNKNNKKWKLNFQIRELKSLKALFLGTGSISKVASKILKSFDVECYGINTDGRRVAGFKKCYSMNEINNIISDIDIVVIALPATKKTKRVLDYELMSKFKDDATIINISRGSAIVESDLIKLLAEDKFLGVSLDVFENEPLEESSPLWEIDRVSITPHNAWISDRMKERKLKLIYKNIAEFKKGGELLNLVDLNRGY